MINEEKVSLDDWRWWVELDEFIGPKIRVDRLKKVTTEPVSRVANLLRTKKN